MTTTLQARDLIKTFETTAPPTHAIRGVDLDVRAGEFVAVMGASGSGKSTLLYALSGLDRPTSGTVRLEGRDLTSLTETEVAHLRLTRMGFVFQQAYFLEYLSVRDNVLLPALKAAPDERTAIARVDALLATFGIDHVGDHGITEVSGGQLQRASICRALACEPAVLFADEPTGALNSATSAEVMDVLSQVHRSRTTIVMVTHDVASASRADRVVYLRDGWVVDERLLGPWDRERMSGREKDLLDWLRSLGF